MTDHEPLVRDWLRGFMPLIQSNISPDETRFRINALAARLAANFAPRVFNDSSFEAVARVLKFFPSYAELVEPLQAWQRENKLTFGLLLSDHRAYEPVPLPPERTEAELNHVQTLARQTVAELQHHETERLASYRKPNELPPTRREMTRAELTEAYRRVGLRGPEVPQ